MFFKMKVWKGCFCNWLRKNWPTLKSYHPLNSHKILNPLFLFPLLQKKISPTCVIWNLGSPPFTKEGAGQETMEMTITCQVDDQKVQTQIQRHKCDKEKTQNSLMLFILTLIQKDRKYATWQKNILNRIYLTLIKYQKSEKNITLSYFKERNFHWLKLLQFW